MNNIKKWEIEICHVHKGWQNLKSIVLKQKCQHTKHKNLDTHRS